MPLKSYFENEIEQRRALQAVGAALSKRRFEAKTLYARAFEYTVTGAAKL